MTDPILCALFIDREFRKTRWFREKPDDVPLQPFQFSAMRDIFGGQSDPVRHLQWETGSAWMQARGIA